MRKFVFLAALLGSGAAHADWIPDFIREDNIVTASMGGGSITYREPRYGGNTRLTSVTQDMLNVQTSLQQQLNTLISKKVAEKGIQFESGSLTGNLRAMIQPDPSGVAFINISGISYSARNVYSGTKLGVISYKCVNTTNINNIEISGQYGAVNGVLVPGKSKMSADVTTSTDCDSNLSWILPVFGSLFINKAENIIDQEVINIASNTINNMKDKLLFNPAQNWVTGLNSLIVPGDIISQLDGTSFPLGNFIRDNYGYLISNSNIVLQFGPGISVRPKIGWGPPGGRAFAANVLTISLNSPAVAFTVKLSQEALVNWQWRCSISIPTKSCPEP